MLRGKSGSGKSISAVPILIASLFFSGCFPAKKPAPPINIAVADLGRENVSSSDAAMMSELLRGELVKTGSFRVIEKNNMDKILAEHTFQKTGCTDQDCAVQLGRILNVERMAMGTFGEFMGKRIMLLRLVEVETGEVVCSDSARGETLEKLESAVSSMAARIARCASAVPRPKTGPVSPNLKPTSLPPASLATGDAFEEDDSATAPAFRDEMNFTDLLAKNMVEGPKTWQFSPFRGARALGWNRSITFTNRSPSQSISVNRIGLRIIGLDGSKIYEGEQAIGLREVESAPGYYTGLPVILAPSQTRNIFLGASIMADGELEKKITDQEARVFLTYEFTQGSSKDVKKGELVIRLNGNWAKSRLAPISGQ